MRRMMSQFELLEEEERLLLEVKKVKTNKVSLLNKKKLSKEELDELFVGKIEEDEFVDEDV